MTFMFEVYYPCPVDKERESRISTALQPFAARLDFYEAPPEGVEGGVVLTFEMPSREAAERGIEAVKALGEYVEGPSPYG